MPELMGRYFPAWRYSRTSAPGVAVAEALETVAPDRWTRWLHADGSGHTRLELAVRTRFVRERGSLISDDTVLPTPFATASEGLAWVFSRPERTPVYGLSWGLLVWTHGPRRLPLSLRLWRRGGPSTDALAWEWLSYARPRRRGRPEDVLCDAR